MLRCTLDLFDLQSLGSTLWDCNGNRGAFTFPINFCLSWYRLRPLHSSSLCSSFSSSLQIAFLRFSSGHTQAIFFMLELRLTFALAPCGLRPSSLQPSPSVVLSSRHFTSMRVTGPKCLMLGGCLVLTVSFGAPVALKAMLDSVLCPVKTKARWCVLRYTSCSTGLMLMLTAYIFPKTFLWVTQVPIASTQKNRSHTVRPRTSLLTFQQRIRKVTNVIFRPWVHSRPLFAQHALCSSFILWSYGMSSPRRVWLSDGPGYKS